jgi:hypothetical protein
MIFLFFGLVRLMLAQLLSSPSFLFFGPASPPIDVVMPSRRVMLPSHLAASVLSSSNTLFYRFLTKSTEALNPHDCYRLLSLDRLISTLYCYKKIVSILTTLLTPQPCLHFASILVEHHTIKARPAVIVSFHCCLTSIVSPHNNTQSDELADPLLLPEQFISM